MSKEKLDSFEKVRDWLEAKDLNSFPITSTSYWKAREYVRLVIGFYNEVPGLSTSDIGLLKQQQPEHFLVQSRAKPEWVMFTPNEMYGKADRHVQIAFTRYLARHTTLGADKQKELAEKHRLALTKSEVKFAVTADEIQHVYTHGPHSCMKRSPSSFSGNGGIHPARAYAGHNVKVAYIEEEGGITARSVVVEISKTDKRYIRIYGDISKLQRLLNKLGYKQGNYKGAIFSLIRVKDKENRAVMPYLDAGPNDADIVDDKIIFGASESYYISSSQSGFADIRKAVKCDLCESVSYTGAAEYVISGNRKACYGCYRQCSRIWYEDGQILVMPRHEVKNAVTAYPSNTLYANKTIARSYGCEDVMTSTNLQILADPNTAVKDEDGMMRMKAECFCFVSKNKKRYRLKRALSLDYGYDPINEMFYAPGSAPEGVESAELFVFRWLYANRDQLYGTYLYPNTSAYLGFDHARTLFGEVNSEYRKLQLSISSRGVRMNSPEVGQYLLDKIEELERGEGHVGKDRSARNDAVQKAALKQRSA